MRFAIATVIWESQRLFHLQQQQKYTDKVVDISDSGKFLTNRDDVDVPANGKISALLLGVIDL